MVLCPPCTRAEVTGRSFATEDEIPAVWEEGDLLLDLYRVEGILGEGGMGTVYKVRHRGWNLNLAVKSPKQEALRGAGGTGGFIDEAEYWVDLGLHTHIVSCYYVRTLGGIPRVFAEYVEGGSLADWISPSQRGDNQENGHDRRNGGSGLGRLYEGGPEAALERILDIAIQFAWGLGYAHERGMVHKDVKPANVMMTPDGIAKVTDFGLAGARPGTEVALDDGAGGSVLVDGTGMTPAYCSPEQARAHAEAQAGVPPNERTKLTRRTDIWSWAISVLEMFLGEWTTVTGLAAPSLLEQCLESGATVEGPPAMPAELAELLRQCLENDPEARPRDFGAVADRLLQLYQSETGKPYRQQEPEPLELRADELNNRAISLLDLGRSDEAERLLEEALAADSQHLEATYNRGLVLWRSARVSDLGLLRQLDELRPMHPGSWQPDYLVGLVHLERGDGALAVEALEAAARAVGERPEILRALATGRSEVAGSPATARTCGRHDETVRSVAFSPDGWYALSGSDDRTLKLWEVETDRCVRTLEGHDGNVTSVAFSPDGRSALSGSWDNTLKLWELETGRCVRTFEGHEDYVGSVAFRPDGRYALSGSSDGTLKLWEVETGRRVITCAGHEESVTSVDFSPDGRYALSGSWDNTLKLWEVETGRCVRTIEGHKSGVSSVSFSPDGRYALSGSWDKTLKLWEVETGRCVRTFEGRGGDVRFVAFCPDGRYALSGSMDNTLKLWEVETGRCVRTFEGHKHVVESVAFSPDGRYALSGSHDKTLKLWELGSPRLQGFAVAVPRGAAELSGLESRMRQHTERARLAIKAGQHSEATVEIREAQRLPGFERAPELLGLWHQVGQYGQRRGLSEAWMCGRLEGHERRVMCVAFSPDGRYALSGSQDKTLKLWEVETGRCVRTTAGHEGRVMSVGCSPDGRYALSGSGDETLKLWEVETGWCVRTIEGHEQPVSSVACGPDGRYALSGSGDKTLKLWEIKTGRCVRTFEGHEELVTSVAFSPDGRDALSGSWDKTLKLWEIETGRCVRTFGEHEQIVESVTFSPDSRYALSGGYGDKTLMLWEVKTGQCVRTFEGHENSVVSVSFSPDGRYALSGSHDKTLKLWEVETGRCVRTIEGHEVWVNSVAFSPDGRYALSGSYDRTPRLWELDWEYEFPDPVDWDEGARPYLETFLTLHTPYAGELPTDRDPSKKEVQRALSRQGHPSWSEDDFERLLTEMAWRGFGWLRPEGVRRKLEEMAAERH